MRILFVCADALLPVAAQGQKRNPAFVSLCVVVCAHVCVFVGWPGHQRDTWRVFLPRKQLHYSETNWSLNRSSFIQPLDSLACCCAADTLLCWAVKLLIWFFWMSPSLPDPVSCLQGQACQWTQWKKIKRRVSFTFVILLSSLLLGNVSLSLIQMNVEWGVLFLISRTKAVCFFWVFLRLSCNIMEIHQFIRISLMI